MAHLNLNEQEQIAQVRYFWKDWGKYIVAGVVLLIIAYLANSVYSWYQQRQANAAAAVYVEFNAAVTAKNTAKIYQITQQLQQQLGGTEYAPMASLVAAKVAFQAKDYARAISLLTWTNAQAKDRSLQSVAALRLASVYIDQGKFDKARELLRSKHDLAFDGLFYEGRGDLYVAQGDLAKARDAYKEGLQKAANDPTTQQTIQMKLDVIGG